MTDELKPTLDRSVAQFFFEVGFGACFAEAVVRNNEAPFELTDAVVERAWDIAPEAHEDGEEFDRYLAASEARATDTQDAESYEIGKRDGYESAVQDIDLMTGGDGEYRYCTDHDPERHTPDAAAMKQRIAERFAAQSTDTQVSKLVSAGTALLDAAERHIFGDECKTERDAFRAALDSMGREG